MAGDASAVVIDAVNATTNGTWTSLHAKSRVSFQAVWTGTIAGTFSFEITNRHDPNRASDTKATTLTLPGGFSSGNPAGSAGDFVFEFVDMAEGFIRPVFTKTGGTGTVTVVVYAKA